MAMEWPGEGLTRQLPPLLRGPGRRPCALLAACLDAV